MFKEIGLLSDTIVYEISASDLWSPDVIREPGERHRRSCRRAAARSSSSTRQGKWEVKQRVN
jgi:hypothetical protein